MTKPAESGLSPQEQLAIPAGQGVGCAWIASGESNMIGKAQVVLTIRYGEFGEQEKTAIVPLSEYLTHELMGRVELSDEPFSVMLASPCLYGGKHDSVTIRRKAFKMRRDVAEGISRAIVPELIKLFGINDELDGYRVDNMSDEEREWQHRRGRI